MRIALLPGAYHEPEDFQREGFGDAVRARGLALDLEFVAPDLAHVLDRSVLEELHRDVVAPARAAGCRSVLVRTGHGRELPAEANAIADLAAAVALWSARGA